MMIKTIDCTPLLKRDVLGSASHIVIHNVPILLRTPSGAKKRVDPVGPQAPPTTAAASAMIARRRPWVPPTDYLDKPFCQAT